MKAIVITQPGAPGVLQIGVKRGRLTRRGCKAHTLVESGRTVGKIVVTI